MAIKIDKKINVRSPFFVEVVDEYLGLQPDVTPEPDPDPITEPIIPSQWFQCNGILYFGSIVGIKRFTHSTTSRELGEFSYKILDIKMPIKVRVYTEGDTVPAYTTVGLDTYASQWLEATGEDATNLSAAASYPDGITHTFSYTTTAATDAISKNIVIDILAPIPTISNMALWSTACQEFEVAVQPTSSGFVTVLTVEARGIYKGAAGQAGSINDVSIALNGTSYALPNNQWSSGVRLILDDITPDYSVLSNDTPYSQSTHGDNEWSYDFSPLRTLVPQEVNPTLVNSGTNTLVITANENVAFAFKVRVAQHPVETISGSKVIKHLGDGTGTSVIKGIVNGFSLGEIRTPSAQESLTLKFSGVNEETLVSESATYHHEEIINEGDSVERFDDVLLYFPVKTTF